MQKQNSCGPRDGRRSLIRAALLVAAWLSAATAHAAIKPSGWGQEPPRSCEAYEASRVPDLHLNDEAERRVYKAPALTNAADSRRCSIRQMAVAVRDIGQLAPIYDDGASSVAGILDPIVARLKARAAAQPDKPLRILIFAHGGRVRQDDAIKEAEGLARAILADGYEPIFLIWNSGDFDVYGDRLCCVSDGRATEPQGLLHFVTALGGDLGASLARAGENYERQRQRFQATFSAHYETDYFLEAPGGRSGGECGQLRIRGAGDMCAGLVLPPFSDFNELNETRHNTSRFLQYAPGFFVRTPITALGGQIGASAWNNMVRRTRLAVETPATSAGTGSDCAIAEPAPFDTDEARKTPRQGGFSMLLTRLRCELLDGGSLVSSDRRAKVELHYYGHSMGALVGNELIWRYPDMPWRRVVYMGAATPIREFRLTVSPLLADRKISFHSLMLHPLNEAQELNGAGALPRGSLLEWVDEMFNGPRTSDERMLGAWRNMEYAATLFPLDQRARMGLRVFPKQHDLRTAGEPTVASSRKSNLMVRECAAFGTNEGRGSVPRCHPVKHGQFADYSFWRPAYWKGLPPKAEASP